MWDSYKDKRYFNRGYAELIMYLTSHQEIEINDEYECADGFLLGKWIKNIREQWSNNELSKDQIRRLQNIGLGINADDQKWETMFRYTKQSIQEKNARRLSSSYVTEDGILVGAWLDRQKRICETSGNLSQDKVDRINSLGD
jgi:hypothetical protein